MKPIILFISLSTLTACNNRSAPNNIAAPDASLTASSDRESALELSAKDSNVASRASETYLVCVADNKDPDAAGTVLCSLEDTSGSKVIIDGQTKTVDFSAKFGDGSAPFEVTTLVDSDFHASFSLKGESDKEIGNWANKVIFSARVTNVSTDTSEVFESMAVPSSND